MDINYREIFDNSAYKLSDIEKAFGISSSQMCGYLYRGIKPNSKTKEKLEKIMNEIQKTQRYIISAHLLDTQLSLRYAR